MSERKRTGGVPTFGKMADEVRQALSAGFRNETHKAQWKSSLATYAGPLNDQACRHHLYGGRSGGPEADLENEVRDRVAGSRPDRKGAGRGQGQRLPRWREPGPMARAP